MLCVAPDSAGDDVYGDYIDRVAGSQLFRCGAYLLAPRTTVVRPYSAVYRDSSQSDTECPQVSWQKGKIVTYADIQGRIGVKW